MSLRQKQSKFARMIALLILHAGELGLEVTFGDAFRDPRLHGKVGVKKGYGHPKSYHKMRLAVDLNLFRNGKYLSSTKAHAPLGEYWESIGGTWGGKFPAPDGNHYSLGEGR